MKACLPILLTILLSVSCLHRAFGTHCGNNSKYGVSAPCKDCPKPGVNTFEPYTGNVQREVEDLELWGSVGELPMIWSRYYTSRGSILWNFSFVYSLYEGGFSGTQPTMVIDYPEGGQNTFTRNAFDTTEWLSAPGIDKRLFKVGNDFYLQMANGFVYHFIRTTLVLGAFTYYIYLLQDIKDSKQNTYTLTYTVNRQLASITEPGGRSFNITYTILGNRRLISQVSTSDGRSVQYQYDIFNDGVSRWIRFLGATYGDGTKAYYTYTQSSPGGSLRLATANDPRYNGRAVKMSYSYNWGIAAGYIKEEKNGITGQVMATLIATGNDRTVCYANGKQEVFNLPANMLGNRKAYTDGLARSTKYGYDQGGLGYRTKDTDALNRVTSYTRTIYGNILNITYPDGSRERWTRDNLDQILTYTDELGRVTTFTRDAAHRITRIDYPNSTFETFTYNNLGQVVNYKGRNGAVEHTVYDMRGLKTSHTDALGNRTTYNYDLSDNLASMTDARGHTTTYEYNERGLITKLTHADLNFQTYTYDTFGNQTSKTDELNHTWITTYDEFRRPVDMIDPLGRITHYGYDLLGGICGCSHNTNSPTSITLPSGKITRIDYDVEWQKISQTVGANTPDAATTSYEYDMVGNLVKIIDPMAKERKMEYGLRDRKIAETAPLGQRKEWTYDSVGNVLTEKRPDNGITAYIFDNMNRMTRTTDSKNQVTQYAYDADDNLIALTDPKNNVYSYQYDLLDRVTRMTYPGSGLSEQYTYDSMHNMATYTNRAGAVRTYTYDSRDRLTLSNWSDSTPDDTVTYDAANRILSRVNSVSALLYNYNIANEMITESQNISGSAGGTKTFIHTYNLDGHRQSTLYPGGDSISYTYTGRNQIATIAKNGPAPLASYAYDPNGNRVSKLLKNGVLTAYSYDDNNRLLTVDNKLASVSFSRFDYGYDDVSNRKFVQRDLGLGDAYTYDATDQVTGVLYDATSPGSMPTGAARTVSYGLDSAGSRTHVTDNLGSVLYNTNSQNQYTSVGSNALTYDGNGNLTAYNGWAYIYDAQNRLISAQDDTTLVTFAYDPVNRCARRTINGIANFFYYNDWNLIEERDVLDTLNSQYVHGTTTDELLIRDTSGIPVYFHYDATGNTAGVTNNAGTLVEKYTYDIFGAPVIRNSANTILSSTTIRFLFSGREYISETGLYDYRHRMYDPLLGRFLQTDPAKFYLSDPDMFQFPGDYNLYHYVWNNPVNQRDPLGLWVIGKKARPGDQTIVCDGNDGISIHLPPTPKGDSPYDKAWYARRDAITKPCIQKHEEGHKAEALKGNPDICKGIAPGMEVREDNTKLQAASEVRCSDIEIDCLKNTVCTTEEEKGFVKKRLNKVQAYKNYYLKKQ